MLGVAARCRIGQLCTFLCVSETTIPIVWCHLSGEHQKITCSCENNLITIHIEALVTNSGAPWRTLVPL